VNLALLTADHTRDNVALKKPIPAGKSQIFRYQTRVSVVDEVQIVRADFVNCRHSAATRVLLLSIRIL
jgi:hypothetical protein